MLKMWSVSGRPKYGALRSRGQALLAVDDPSLLHEPELVISTGSTAVVLYANTPFSSILCLTKFNCILCHDGSGVAMASVLQAVF